MTVYLVGAGPGDPGLLTRRGAELLAGADVVVYDRLVDPALLLMTRPGAELVDAGKEPHAAGQATAAGAAAQQVAINRLLVDHGRAGRRVVRLKGGDPFVFGRGGEEAEALSAAGVDYEVVPGVTSAFAVPACAGVPVTHRGLSTSVTVVTGHATETGTSGGVDWESLGRAGGTLVVLMGMANREVIARRLIDAGRPPGTPVAVTQWGATPAQRVVRTTLDGLAGVSLGSPAVIVIGAVAGLDLAPAPTRPLAGRSVVVTRRPEQAGALSAALAGAGARVVELPVIALAPPADGGAALAAAATGLEAYRWVVFTSANAVERFLDALSDVRLLGPAMLAAVGPATADALGRHRLVADLVPPGASAQGLAGAFPEAPPAPAGRRVLFVRAAQARRSVPEGLAAKGWAVDEVEAYRTVAAAPPPEAALGVLASADAVIFASPSAVAAYLAMRSAGGTPLPVPPVVACIGPVTAAAAREAGLEVAAEAQSPDPGSLVDALVGALRPAGGAGGAPEHPR